MRFRRVSGRPEQCSPNSTSFGRTVTGYVREWVVHLGKILNRNWYGIQYSCPQLAMFTRCVTGNRAFCLVYKKPRSRFVTLEHQAPLSVNPNRCNSCFHGDFRHITDLRSLSDLDHGLVFSWCFRKHATLTPSPYVRRGVLKGFAVLLGSILLCITRV